MKTEADGFGYAMNGDRYNGGYSGYGTGASSALPGASWLLPSRPFGLREAEPDAGDGYAPPPRRHAPPTRPTDTTPSIPTNTPPVTPPKPGDEEGTPPPTDTQRLIDAFRAMFGTPERRNRDDGSVILVDAAQQGGGGGGVSPVAVAVLLGAGVGGWLLWKRYGRKAVAA